MVRIFLISLLVLIGVFNEGFAQIVLQYKSLKSQNEQTNLAAFNVGLDRDGYVWVAGLDGLARYDGREWITIGNSKNSVSKLHENYTFDMDFDSNGDIWVATQNGMARIDRNSLVQKDTIPNLNLGSDIRVGPTHLIGAAEGNFTITNKEGVKVYVKYFTGFNTFLLPNINNALLASKDSLVSLELDSSLQLTQTIFSLNNDFEGAEMLSLIDEKRALVQNGKELFIWEFSQSTIKPIKGNNLFQANTEIISFKNCVVDQFGGIWSILNGRLHYIFRDENEDYIMLRVVDGNSPDTKNPILSPLSFRIDPKGVLWIGDNVNFVISVDTRQLFFKRLNLAHFLPELTGDTNLWSLAWNNEGDRLFLTGDGVAFKVQLSSSFFDMKPNQPLESLISSVQKINIDLNGTPPILSPFFKGETVYFNYYRNGIYQIPWANNQMRLIHKTPAEERLYSRVQVGDSVFWSGLGQVTLQNENDVFKKLDLKLDSLVLGTIYNLSYDKSKHQLLLSVVNGFYTYALEDGVFSTIMGADKKKSLVGNTNFFDAWGENGRYIVASFGSGLLDFPNGGNPKLIDGNGLNHPIVYDVIKDSDDNFWIPTNNGIHRADFNLNQLVAFTETSGNMITTFNQTGTFWDDEWMGFTGTKGLLLIRPSEFGRWFSQEPQISISKIEWIDENGEEQALFGTPPDVLKIPNGSAYASLFPVVGDISSERYPIQYRWNGAGNWEPLSQRTHAIFLNILEAGEHRLTLRYRTLKGDWGEKDDFIVEITVPFWERTSTRIFLVFLITLSVGTFVWLTVRIRYRRQLKILELEQERQKERESLSRDLHDSIGTQLSLIVHHLSDSGNKQEAQTLAASEIAKSSLTQLRETLWMLKRQETSLHDLFQRISSLANKLCVGTNLQVSSKDSIKTNHILSPIQSLNLIRIAEESITNSIKYSQADSIVVEVASTISSWQLTISDNGIGFDPEKIDPSESYGISHIKHRAQEMSTSVFITSSSEHGTRIQIQGKV